MGFLDKLLGRKKDDAEGMQTAPPPATMPEGDTSRPSAQDEGEHEHEGEHDHEH